MGHPADVCLALGLPGHIENQFGHLPLLTESSYVIEWGDVIYDLINWLACRIASPGFLAFFVYRV